MVEDSSLQLARTIINDSWNEAPLSIISLTVSFLPLRLVNIIRGHTSAITCLVNLDHNYIISGGWDRTIRLWNVKNKKCIRVFSGHSDWIRCILRLDSHHFVTGSLDSSIKIWGVNNFTNVSNINSHDECLLTLTAHTSSVTCLASLNTRFPTSLNYYNQYIISGSLDKSLIIWELQYSNKNNNYRKKPTTTQRLDDNESVLGKFVMKLTGHTDWVRCVTTFITSHKKYLNISDNNRIKVPLILIISGSNDATVRLWDADDGSCLQVFTAHSAAVRYVNIIDLNTGIIYENNNFHILNNNSDNNKYMIVSSSMDNTVKIWRPINIMTSYLSKFIFNLFGHSDSIMCIVSVHLSGLDSGKYSDTTDQTSKYNYLLVTGSLDSTLKVWSIHLDSQYPILINDTDQMYNGSTMCVHTLTGHVGGIYCLTTLDDNLIISGGVDCTIRLWNILQGSSLQVFEYHTAPVLCLISCVFNNQKMNYFFISGSEDSNMMVFDRALKTNDNTMKKKKKINENQTRINIKRKRKNNK